MYWQDTRLVDAKSLTGTSGSETIDLPASGLLAGLTIRFDARESETARTHHRSQIDCLTKIEVVHAGTQIIKSFNGRVARGISFLDDGKVPLSSRGFAALGYNGFVYVPIHFGRRERDTEYALDLAKLVDPKLKIEWDCTLTDPWTGYGFHSTPVATLTVITKIIKEPLSAPRGYIKTAQVKEYTQENDTIEPVKMPLGNPFRRILVRPVDWDTTNGVYFAFRPDQIVDYIELNINDGERIPVKLKAEDIVQAYIRDYGQALYTERELIRNGDNILRPIGYVQTAHIGSLQDHAVMMFHSGVSPGSGVYVMDFNGAAYNSDTYGLWTAKGPMFENIIPIAFDLDGFDYLLETRDLSKVKLDITGALATYTAKVYVYLEELVTQ